MAITDVVTVSRPSNATYFDANGVMQTAANNVWRRDHDPVTGAPRGVLIEEARTNYMLRSGDPGGVGYTVTGMTVTLNAGVAPNGENVATLLVEDTSTGQHRTSQTPSDVPAAGTVFWNGVFVKKLPGSPRSLVMVENLRYGDHTKRTTAYFDLNTGQFVSVVGTLPEARVEALRDGWFRLYNFGEAAGTGVVGLNVGLALNPTTASYEGDGVSGLYVWGFSRENGAFPTSYIPTTTAAATRAAERLFTSTGSWYDPNKGTLLVEYADALPIAAQYGYIVGLNRAGGTSTYIGLAVNGQLSLEGFRSSSFATAHFNRPYSLGAKRYALGWDAAGSSSVRNGEAPVLAGPIADTNLLTQLVLGNLSASQNLVIGKVHIRSIQYYPRRLSNAELQAATVLS